MEIKSPLAGKIVLVGQFIFVAYFILFLIVDMMVEFGAMEYDFLDPPLYYSSSVNAAISLLLLLLIFILMRKEGMMKVVLLGAVFLASPLRALFMFNLGVIGGISINSIFDLVVIFLSAFLLYKFARNMGSMSVGLGFVALFYFYIFLVYVAIPVRDFMVMSNMFLPISYGSYLHFGFYDYLTAGYAIALGLYGLKLLYPELKKTGEGDKNISQMNALIASGNYKTAVELGERIIESGESTDLAAVKVLMAYAYLKAKEPEKAYKIIEGVEGHEGLKGDICVALVKMNEAKMHYKLAVDENPKDYVSMVNLGKIYADEDNIREAEAWWNRALEVNKKDPVVWQNLSALEVVRGRHDAALNVLKEARKHVKA